MYASRKKTSAALQRSQERRQREDDAPRLTQEVPTLSTLQIGITEKSATGTTTYLKHVVVSRAPALFIITCGDHRCEDGGHDITTHVMRALRSHAERTEGDHECGGTTGSAPCARTIHYQITAAYNAP